jgi:hypothetical protein
MGPAVRKDAHWSAIGKLNDLLRAAGARARQKYLRLLARLLLLYCHIDSIVFCAA